MVPVEQVLVVTEPEEKAERDGPATTGEKEAAAAVENKEAAATEKMEVAAMETKELAATAEKEPDPEPEPVKEDTANGGSEEATDEDDPEARRDQMLNDWSDLGTDVLLDAALQSATR